MKSHRPFECSNVEAVFDAWPSVRRADLLDLRDLIFETASEIDRVGPLVETLKWGQPSYLPSKPKVGSTVRIDVLKNDPDRYAMYFHCQTSLVATFRDIYPGQFEFQGNRALVLTHGETVPVEAARHCIALALTYHVNRKRGRPAAHVGLPSKSIS